MIAERELAKELESTTVIRFQDCDPFQHLNNSLYIDYFMNAREDQLNQFYDFRIFEVFQETGHSWVVSKNQIAYLTPAVMLETILIRTKLIQMTENLLVVEGLMLDKTGQRLKAVTWLEFTFISLLNGRAAAHPSDFMSAFQSARVDGIFEPDGFNRRVDALKTQYRKQPVA
jgi:thioesterase III